MLKEKYTIKDFLPFIIIFSVILIVSVFTYSSNNDAALGMRTFMAGFFIVFGVLKLIKLKSFAEAYQMYSILAMVKFK